MRTKSSEASADAALLSSLETQHPGGTRVTLDPDGVLHWPVLFVYPEFGEIDSIASFNEQSWLVTYDFELF